MSSREKITKQILICQCRGERIVYEKLAEIRKHVEKLPVKTIILSDLCGLAVNRESLTGMLGVPSEWLIIVCHARSMNLLLENAAGTGMRGGLFKHIDLIETSVPEALKDAESFCSDCGNVGSASVEEITEGSGWHSWYPVIDHSRCTACGQCADFCLFGVYEKIPGMVNMLGPVLGGALAAIFFVKLIEPAMAGKSKASNCK